MKKTFSTKNPNKNPERQLDAIKHEISKYVGRERRKKFPEDVNGWEFDCKVGATVDVAESVIISEINSAIDSLISAGKEEFYVEVVSRPRRAK